MRLFVFLLLVGFSLVPGGAAYGQDEEAKKADEFYIGRDYYLAIRKYRSLFEENPTYSSGIKLATAYKNNHQYDRAETTLNAIKDMEGFTAEDLLTLGKLYLHNQKYDAAATTFQAVRQKIPANPELPLLEEFAALRGKGQISIDCQPSKSDVLCVTIDAKSSIDPNNPHLIFEWIIDESPPKTGFTVEHCFAEEGTYYARLNIIDITTGLKYNNDTILPITVGGEGNLEISGNKFAGSDITFMPDPSLLFGEKTYNFLWEFGDGNFQSGETIQHSFQKSGTYDIRLYLISTNQDGIREVSCITESIVITTNIHDLY